MEETIEQYIEDSAHRTWAETVTAMEWPTFQLVVLSAARTAHEVNRVYCCTIGDTSQPDWLDAPVWQQKSAVNGVLHVIRNPSTTPMQSHESWLAEKVADGWVYGEKKNVVLRTHPCIMPYVELPANQRIKDSYYLAVVRAIIGAWDL